MPGDKMADHSSPGGASMDRQKAHRMMDSERPERATRKGQGADDVQGNPGDDTGDSEDQHLPPTTTSETDPA